MAHLLATMQHQPLGPIRRQMYEHHFKEMEDCIEKNLIAEAAVYISGMGMLTYPMPMFYQVWFECVLGKIAIRAGHYKAAKKQFEHAKDIWHGPNGWKSGDASIEDVKKQESHDRMIADNVEKCNRGLAEELPAHRLYSAGDALDGHLCIFLAKLESRH